MRAGVSAVVRRDLRVELRRREAVPAMTLLALGVFVLLHFGLDRDRLEGDLAAGVFWMAILLATVLGVSRLSSAEADGRLDGLRLAPLDPVALFAAKAAVLFVFLAAVEVIALPAFAVLLLGAGSAGALPWIALVLVTADLALAAIGALVSAVASTSGSRDLLVPLLLVPLMVPVMIAAAAASKPLAAAGADPAGLAGWLAVMACYGAVFGLVGAAVFGELIED